MLSERSRNMLVGLTMLVALIVTMYGVLLLGKFQNAGIHTYNITLLTLNAGGVVSGDKVQLNGVIVGQVAQVDLQNRPAATRPQPSTTPSTTQATTVPATAEAPPQVLMARIILQIDNAADIPASAKATIGKPSVGNSIVSIAADSIGGSVLAHDGTAVLVGEPADTGLIPREVVADIRALKADLTPLALQLTDVARDLHSLFQYAPPEAVENENDPNRPRENISTAVIRIDRTVKSLQSLLGDPAIHTQVRQAVQNIADASLQLKTTLQNVDATVKNVDATLTKAGTASTAITTAATQASVTLQSTQREIEKTSQHLADSLAQLDKTLRQISEGNGTTGKLINDPRLYEGLNDLSRSLRSTVDDLDFLIKKWKDEGVDLRLK